MTIAQAIFGSPSPDSIGHLLQQLGDVPPARVLFHPEPGQATEADLLELIERHDRLCELVDGTLVEKPVGWQESILAVALARILGEFIRNKRLGVLAGPDGPIRLRMGLVRLPDLAFFSWDRLPGPISQQPPIPSLVPDLAIEILSESNTKAEMLRKQEEYFKAGVQLMWIIDPDVRQATVLAPGASRVSVGVNDTLDGGSVLPEFSLSLKELFAELDACPPAKD